MKAELIFILERFPELKEQLTSLFECDEEFQALCLDYFLCIRSLDHWEVTVRKYQERLEGYEELKRVLENKMLQQLNQDKGSKIDSYDSDIRELDNNGHKLR